jgi:hypothetical protein
MTNGKPLKIVPRESPEEPPPLLGSWKRVYVSVLLYLAGLISLFYLFTRMLNQ